MNQAESPVPNNALRDARLSCRWTQAELADKVGCDAKSIRRWEHGLSLPSLFYVRKLCQALNKDARALGFLPDDPKPVGVPGNDPVVLENADVEEHQAIFDPAVPLLPDKAFVGREQDLIGIKQQLCGRGNRDRKSTR